MIVKADRLAHKVDKIYRPKKHEGNDCRRSMAVKPMGRPIIVVDKGSLTRSSVGNIGLVIPFTITEESGEITDRTNVGNITDRTNVEKEMGSRKSPADEEIGSMKSVADQEDELAEMYFSKIKMVLEDIYHPDCMEIASEILFNDIHGPNSEKNELKNCSIRKNLQNSKNFKIRFNLAFLLTVSSGLSSFPFLTYGTFIANIKFRDSSACLFINLEITTSLLISVFVGYFCTCYMGRKNNFVMGILLQLLGLVLLIIFIATTKSTGLLYMPIMLVAIGHSISFMINYQIYIQEIFQENNSIRDVCEYYVQYTCA